MKKRHVIILFLIFITLNAAFAQKKGVVWLGYDIDKSENAAIRDDNLKYDIFFFNTLRELDKNNGYLDIFPGYDRKTPNPPLADYPYEITGTIKQYRGFTYEINTELRHNKILALPFFKRNDTSENSLHDLIEKHAKDVYAYFEDLVLTEKEGNLPQLLADFDKEYMQKISSINVEEFNRAFWRLSIIEDKFGKSEEINKRREGIEYSAIAVPLSKAEENIARAFDRRVPNDSSESFCKDAEYFALQVRQVIGQTKDSRFLGRLEKVESKIEEYRTKSQFAVYTGGLGLFIEKPLPMVLFGSNIDLQETYPYILGLNLRYVIPFSLPLFWYFQFSYTGINGSTKEVPAAYLTEAAIDYFSLSTGMHLQYYINRIIAPYGYFGIGYTHLIEYASDGKDSVSLNFPGMIMDVGFGSRFHITPKFALEARAQWSLLTYESMMMAVNFSLGGSYLFHGKEDLIRR
jgi:hypothetical protein